MPANDLTLYEDHAHGWWDKTNPYFRSLISVNDFRLELIREWLKPSPGQTVVDIGCGGGLIAAPFDQAGADVIGIDLSPGSLRTAGQHCSKRARFIAGDARAIPLADDLADIVIIADVLDHIAEYKTAIAEGARVLRHGGKMFVTTLNRSFFSWFATVLVAEGLGYIPRGTHDARLFVKPSELEAAAAESSLKLLDTSGATPQLAKTIRTHTIHLKRGNSKALFYAMLFEKRLPD